MKQTDDLRIHAIKELSTPAQVHRELPITEGAAQTVFDTRQAIHRILHDEDDRLLVIIGPCSVHDSEGLDFSTSSRENAGTQQRSRRTTFNAVEQRRQSLQSEAGQGRGMAVDLSRSWSVVLHQWKSLHS